LGTPDVTCPGDDGLFEFSGCIVAITALANLCRVESEKPGYKVISGCSNTTAADCHVECDKENGFIGNASVTCPFQDQEFLFTGCESESPVSSDMSSSCNSSNRYLESCNRNRFGVLIATIISAAIGFLVAASNYYAKEKPKGTGFWVWIANAFQILIVLTGLALSSAGLHYHLISTGHYKSQQGNAVLSDNLCISGAVLTTLFWIIADFSLWYNRR